MKHLLLILSFVCLLPMTAFAFPDNGTPLEAFTGVDDTSPPNSNWTNATINVCTTGLEIRSNQVAGVTSGGNCWAYWDTTSFNADQEAYADITTTTIVRGDVGLRLANIGSGTTDGYAVSWQDAVSEIRIYRIDNNTFTQLGATISQAVGAGDQFGGTAIGDQICAWFNDGGAGWVEIGCRTDSTYSAGGFIGLGSNNGTNTPGMDNFGGGNVAAATTGGMKARKAVRF